MPTPDGVALADLRVLVIGGGLMGSQIAFEYALGGCDVVVVGRRPDKARRRIDAVLELIEEVDLLPAEVAAAAGQRLTLASPTAIADGPYDVVVESLPEVLDLKVENLRHAADASPDAILATNTSSIPIAAIGASLPSPSRLVGTHYWNPPILMAQVEVIAGKDTASEYTAWISAILSALGKEPVPVARDVPGFIWNRLQAALLREATWLVENGVATPAVVDSVVRSGLARRATQTGPFETAALGGVEVWTALATRLFPELSDRLDPPDLGKLVPVDPQALADLRARRDRALARMARQGSAKPAD